MTQKDRDRLRELAASYAEYANGEVMAQRREKWRPHNDLREKTFPFHIEDNGTYHADLMPPLVCEDDACRALEGRLLKSIVSYEMIDDDRIIPNRFVVDWCTPVTGQCNDLELRRADDGHGKSFGYKTNKPIKNLDTDIGKDHFIEFVYRDTNRLTGDMTHRVAGTCNTIRELTGHHEGSRD